MWLAGGTYLLLWVQAGWGLGERGGSLFRGAILSHPKTQKDPEGAFGGFLGVKYLLGVGMSRV